MAAESVCLQSELKFGQLLLLLLLLQWLLYLHTYIDMYILLTLLSWHVTPAHEQQGSSVKMTGFRL